MELKAKMTFEEMARHMEENTYRIANRVNVGRYAREMGYRVYKPMIDGRIYLFYINHRKTSKRHMVTTKRQHAPGGLAYPGFSYLLSPEEERFLKHMKEFEYIRRRGYSVNFTRAQYMRRMGLREYTFDRCARSLCRLGLIVKTEDSSRNRVHYRLNEEAYERLVRIVTTTRNIDRLIAFFDLHCFKLGKDILSLTDEEIDTLLR